MTTMAEAGRILGKIGGLAYYETVRDGLLPCKVIAWQQNSAYYGGEARLVIRLTGRKGASAYGPRVFTAPVRHVLPRKAVYTKRGSYGRTRMVLPYRWEGQSCQ